MKKIKTLNEEIKRMKSLFHYEEGSTILETIDIYEQDEQNELGLLSPPNCDVSEEISHIGEFSATKSDATKPFTDFITKMKTQIDGNGELKKLIDEGGKVFITELTVMGGASNHYNKKATAADVENDYKTPYAGNIKQDSGYKANRGYAKSRALNLVNAMVKQLPGMGVKVAEEVLENAKNNIDVKVINTGGKNDSSSTAKNPGQIVKIYMKICGDKGGTDILKCFESATIRVDYDSKSPDQTHVCNHAVYDIYANGVKLERTDGVPYASLNNDYRQSTNFKPQKTSNDGNNNGGAYVYNEFKLTMDGVNKEFFNEENLYKYNGGLVVSAKCVRTSHGSWKNNSDCHEWVGDIKLSTSDGVETVEVGQTDLSGTGLKFSTPNNFDAIVPLAGFEACKDLANNNDKPVGDQ